MDLRLVSDKLNQPPFNKNLSVIQLHDEVPAYALVQLISDVAAYLEEGGPVPSVHKVDIRNEEPEATAWRISEFMRILKFRGPGLDVNSLRQEIQDADRPLLLEILYFLMKDMALHKKRCYLAPFLEIVDVPSDYMQDDVMLELSEQVSMMQDQFKELHKYVEGLRTTGGATASIKREIQQMEEEKQQVLSKIGKIKKKVEQVPNHQIWLEAAKKLRIEQQSEANLLERIREQRNAVQNADKKYAAAQQTLKEVRNTSMSGGAEALLAKMQEECKMNKYLAKENLPKSMEETKQRIRDLKRVISEPPLREVDFDKMDNEIKELNNETAKLAEKKLLKANSGDDKLALFRQQAAIIARKKEGTAQKLNSLTEEVTKLSDELDSRREQTRGPGGGRVLKGDDLKKYISELRGKSNTYKLKRAELSEIQAESGILQRTEQILRTRQQSMDSSLSEIERRSGVPGYHAQRDNLEKVSERKSEIDELKGKTLNEISEIISSLVNGINEKKTVLAPVIQELRKLRVVASDLEADYVERKRHYDGLMVGLDSEAVKLEQEVKGYRQDIQNDQSRFHYLNMSIGLIDVAQEKVLHEMKAYIGGDDAIEAQQKARGFKTYRDVYNKKIVEQENAGKSLREQQKDIKAKHEPNVKQLSFFTDVKKLLQLKVAHNQRLLNGGGMDTSGFTQITQDRLVL
ncbi:UNVERIFIED_CONTAM: Intraflagellar transport protein 81 [Siphonaria sp. JEL0065]|nr:Intraflagellar transport protein 81 [Siphonaria sp. JEL0065]